MKFDCVIATDCGQLRAAGQGGQPASASASCSSTSIITRATRVTRTSTGFRAKEASSGEIIFRFLKAANWPITPAIADCLFTAVSTDTGSFQYPNTRPSTYNVAGELVKRGANLAKICDEVYQSYPLSRVRLLKHVYNHFRLTHDNQIAYFWLKQADFTRTGAETDDSEGLIDHIRAIEPVVVACLFEEMAPDLTRISLRSKSDKVNVNEIAAQFGGGGHRAAAGARIPGPPLSVQRRVIAAVKKALDAAK